MSGRPACDDPNASRMRSVGELASVQAIPRVFQSVLSLVDITDLTLSCEASPGQRVSGRRLVLYGAVENQVVPGLFAELSAASLA